MVKKQLLLFWICLLLPGLTGLWAQQSALLVSGADPGSINPGDQAIETALQNLGYSVQVKGGPNSPVSSADANNVDLVFISATSDANNIGNTFTHVNTPVIVSQSYLLDDMHMTGSRTYYDYGIAYYVSNMTITNTNHPIAQSIQGVIPVSTANTELRWGKPSNDADKIARLTGRGNKYGIFSYDAGDNMVGMQAPATRIGFFFDTWTSTHSTAQGWTLFNQAVQYATGLTNCTADAGSLSIDQNPVNLVNGTATVSATPDGNIHVPHGYSTIYVLTSGNNLVIEQVSATPDFTVAATGRYTLHTLVYDADPHSPNFLDLSVVVPGTTTGGDVVGIVTANGICASLDVAGAPVHVNGCSADAGTITIDASPVSLNNGSATVSATPDGNIHVPNGYSVLYLLTSGSNLVIEQANTNPDFTVHTAGNYTIHTLVYDADPHSPDYVDVSLIHFGVTTGADALNYINHNNICASLDVAGAPVEVTGACVADAGTLTIVESNVTLANGSAMVSATPDGNINVPTGYSVLYVLTSGSNLVIEQVNTTPDFTVNAAGNYTIHTLVYDGDPNSPNFLDLSVVVPGTTTGGDVLGIVTANGICASLDVAGAPVHVDECSADAGTLTIDASSVTLANGSAMVSATPDGNINVPTGYSVLYVLTSGSNLVIEQVNTTPDFTVNAAGNYTIHTLVYDGDPNSPNFLDLSVVVPGTTTGGDVLGIVTANGICASLDVAGAPVHVDECTADAGTLTIDASSVTLANGSAMVSATPDGNINVPNGYSVLYVLTSGSNLVIEQVNTTPDFTVNVAGNYTLHTLVYDGDPNSPNFLDLSVVVPGTTTGGDVLGIVTANGICASLDVAGAPVHVDECSADAGTLTIDASSVTLANGSAMVSATPDGNINVPTGYSVLYVLTSGSNLVIEQVNTTPDFTVNAAGNYTLHTLVYDGDPNSPNFLDLSVVVPGTTTGGDVLGIVTANGICASLDVAGAPVHVDECSADAGTLTIDASSVTLANGSAMVSATPDGNINVPSGYSVLYVLTSGSNLVIEQVNTTPDFTVNAAGNYTLHTLVYDGDPNSPNFLDLSVVVPGTTTGGDVLGIVTANGICASLDVAGAPVHVDECSADAGTLTIDASSVTLANGSAMVSATPDGNINVPSGYSVLYVLTSGSNLVIEQVNTTPDFTVNAAGNYTLHTLVYDGDPNSPNFLDLSVVVPGTTTGGDVLGIVTANGICASLDVAGAPVHVDECSADAGTLTIDASSVTLANGSAMVSATPDGNINVPTGYSVLYVLTSGSNLVIEQVNTTPDFTVNAAGNYTLHTLVYDGDPNSPNFLDLSVVVPGTTTGGDVLGIVTANGICASLDVAGAPVHVDECSADAGTLTIDASSVTLANGSAMVSATPDGNINVPNGYSVLYVLTSGSNLVIEQVNTTPDFTVNAAGNYTLHTLVYDGDPNSPNFLDLSVVVPGTTTGGDVLGIVTANGICASLDVAGAPVHVDECSADAGTLTIDASSVTLANGSAMVSATPDGNINVPNGYSVLYVLTSGSNLVIEQVNTTPDFTVNAAGNYTLHTLVYDGDPNSPNFLDLSVVVPGTTTGGDVLGIVTANGICASLDVAGAPVHVDECSADAGTLTIDASSVTLANGSAMVSATPDGNINVPAGYSVLYVLTSGSNLVIEQVNTTPDFTVNAAGNYTLHTLVYDGDPNSPNFLDLSVVVPGTTTGGDVLGIVTANGICASLDVAGAPVHVDECTADAGTLTIDASSVTLANGSAMVSATPDGNINVPTGYSVLYVLTSGSNLVIEQVNTTPDFTVNAAGNYTLHTLVYDGDPNSPNFLDLSVVVPGTTTGGDVLGIVTANGICASLDVAGAPVHVDECSADAGTLTIDASSVTLANGSAMVSATPDGNINVPSGYSVLYVLTSGSNLVIEQVNTTPDFTVNAAGNYTIHTLVYDGDPNSPNFLDLSVVVPGTTTGGDVLGIVTANGICASLDVAGAPVHVDECSADAGTLTIDASSVTLANGSAMVSATPDGNINVPTGYSVLYVLTSGSNLVIEQVNTTPDFTVNAAGNYTLHTLVYDGDPNSPNFLDLSVVVPGTTTGGDVLGIVTANGICASLDVAGAPVHVDECTADAGTLTIDASSVTLANGSAMVSATPDGNINVPTGYSVLYVLTSGSNLVIEQVNTTPDFTVNAAGNYTLHTLVYDGDPNSPNFLDLSVVVPGTTTGGDVLGIVTANGICASLDVAGAPVHVDECSADAGTLTIDASSVTLANGSAMVSATPDGNINVPTGYSVLYVLTSGSNLVIEQVNTTPDFTVNAAGNYTLHTLVYDGDPNSPNFLDLSVVVPGTTTGGDVLGIVTANGICASLDVAGAPVHVDECSADAGTLTIDASSVTLANGSAMVSATPDGNINVPSGYSVLYVLTSGSNLVIEQVNTTPDFTVNVAGNYTLHTLVYDGDPNSPNFLDLSVVVPGTTTGGDVLGIVTANGICASLDVAGAPVHVDAECSADAGSISPDHVLVFVPRNDTISISATPDGNVNVPSGYSTLYVLTQGLGLVIEQVSVTPTFDVTRRGLYRIHTLVYDADPSSPNFLDLSVVVPGTTTGLDVLHLIDNAGICASLDARGAITIVLHTFSFAHFSANNVLNQVQIDWVAQEAVEGATYVIERSQDGIVYQQIGSLVEHTNLEKAEYSMMDKNPLKGFTTYRLRVLDSRGQTIQTEESTLFVELTDGLNITTFPNPVSSTLTVQRNDRVDGNLSVKVMDLMGKEVKKVNELLEPGNAIEINMADLPEGFYQVILFDEMGSSVQTHKIMRR